MRFAHFSFINLFWILGLLFVFMIWAYRHKKAVTEKFVEPKLWNEVASSLDRSKEILKSWLLMGVLSFSVIALMRPQWGFEWREVKRQGLDMIVAMDTSKSMLAQDIKPNRLERSKLGIRDLIKKLAGDRIGLVAFAGDAFLVCPLTVDYAGFLLSLDDLSSQTIPHGGTNVGGALAKAIASFEKVPSQYQSILILTDGENLEGDPLSMAEEARKKGIKIFCIGIGSPEGELIQFKNDIGQNEFVKDENGNFVKSRLNEDLLQKIALKTGGLYVRAGGAQFGMDIIHEQLAGMEKRDIKSQMEKKFHERFQWPLAAAVFLLMAETLIIPRKNP